MLSLIPPSTLTYRRCAVGADRDVLDGADLVERDGAGPGDGAARFDHQLAAPAARRRRTRCARWRRAWRPGPRTGGGSSCGRYEMPRPPPRSTVEICAVLSTPNSATTSRSSPITRWAASSKPATSKICDPMWLCRPTSRRLSVSKTRRTASIAAPLASDSPNFWSSWAVEMNSWVCASTPTVTRTSTSCTTPAVAGDLVEPLDLGHRVEHDVPDAGLDRGGQLVDGFVVAVQGDSLRREAGVQRDRELAAAARRPATGPPRRSSARSRCTETPWPRSARARRRRTPRRCRGSGTGSRPRR